MIARYFKTAPEFRRWLAAHHDKERELLVGFFKKSSGQPGISYKEAVDEALCFGWIDGIKKRVDEHRYTHRFSPRKADSVWSLVNTNRVNELIALRRMTKPGLDAFKRRNPEKTGIYSFERAHAAFDAALERTFKREAGYQKLLTFYVMSAKQQATRERRLAVLIKSSAEGKRIR